MEQEEIDRMAFLVRAQLARQVLQGHPPPDPILIASKRGNVVDYAPHRFFGDLEKIITTGGPKP